MTPQQEGEERERMPESDDEHLINHLRDTHALEQQSIRQLERSQHMSRAPDMEEIYREHLEQTREHEQMIKERIGARDLKPSAVKDLTMRAGAIGLRQLAEIPPDTPVKLAMHFFAFEHLEIATYEMLIQIAERVGDDETKQAAEKILEQERAAAEKIEGTFERAVELMFEAEEHESSEDDDSSEEDSSSEEDETSSSEEDETSSSEEDQTSSSEEDEGSEGGSEKAGATAESDRG